MDAAACRSATTGVGPPPETATVVAWLVRPACAAEFSDARVGVSVGGLP